MGAKLSKKKLISVKEAILHEGSFLEKEAFNLKVTKEELMDQLAAMYDGGKKNSQYKAVLSNSNLNVTHVSEDELQKMQVVRTRKTRQKAKAPVAPPKPNDSETAVSTKLHNADEGEISAEMIEAILKKKKEIEAQIVTAEESEKKLKDVVKIREHTVEKAKEVFEKAQKALDTAEAELKLAYDEVTRISSEVNEARLALDKIEEMVEKAKRKVYLVSPWYSGELPKYGTLISTVEMDRCVLQEVPEEYLPEMNVEGILLFDFVPDYKKARNFIGLVSMYELENKGYSVLNDDERVERLLKMTI